MRSGFRALQALVWITQLGLSVAGPPVVFILLAVWLHSRFGWGGWVVAVGVVLGVLGAVGGLVNALRTVNRLPKQEAQPPQGFNDHD